VSSCAIWCAAGRTFAWIARLRCLRGIDTLSALGLCAEIGEWERFDHPDQLASYLGIVPSEHTSGAQRRLGSITKAGSTHARRLLGDRHLHSPSRPGSADIPAGGRPPHARRLAPTEVHANHPQETDQLTLTPSDTPLRLTRRPEHPGSRTPTPRSVA